MKIKYLLLTICLVFSHLIMAIDLETDTFKTKSNKEVIITFIKHGSLMLTYDGLQIQVDPVTMFADYTTFPKADFILITHEHADHLDSVAINQISHETCHAPVEKLTLK